MPWMQVEPVLLDGLPGDLCQRRYTGHRKGCPNYGKRPTCPPQAMLWTPDFCWGKTWYAVWHVFDFGTHVEKMRVAHPTWTERQLANCLYWQGTARKELRAEVLRFLHILPPPVPEVHWVPEAHGVNVTETMRRIGVELEWPPRTVTHQVALIGIDAGDRTIDPEWHKLGEKARTRWFSENDDPADPPT